MTRLTRSSLAARARALAGDIDEKRWEAARLAVDAKASARTIPDWVEILKVEFRRAKSTIYGWVRIVEWMTDHHIPCLLSISFYDSAERHSDKVSDKDIRELLRTYAGTVGATVEDFRIEIARLAGPDESMENHNAWLSKESARLRRKANDFGLPEFMRTGLLRAAVVIEQTLEGERVTA